MALGMDTLYLSAWTMRVICHEQLAPAVGVALVLTWLISHLLSALPIQYDMVVP